jgi:ABC-type lipoprotein export system ATPase subunit
MPILEITNLKKAYASPDCGRVEIIDVPALRLEAGMQTALAGGSGSGKTTLLHLIAGIVAADAGEIRIAGLPMTGVRESQRDALRARHVGYVFQTFNLLAGFTALENVELGMLFGVGRDTPRARALLERVGMGGRLNFRPRQLSVGQQQRVAVARALANRPDLVLADEPTGNLDARHAAEALALIRDVCRENGAALLIVSHDPRVLDAFEQRLNLADINLAAAAPLAPAGVRP